MKKTWQMKRLFLRQTAALMLWEERQRAMSFFARYGYTPRTAAALVQAEYFNKGQAMAYAGDRCVGVSGIRRCILYAGVKNIFLSFTSAPPA